MGSKNLKTTKGEKKRQKPCQPRVVSSIILFLKTEGVIKTFRWTKIEELAVLQELWKVLWLERKWH